jgi:hypothetical protein
LLLYYVSKVIEGERKRLELEQQQDFDTYSLFVFNIRSASTRDYYLRRLKGFFNYIDLLPNESIISRCDYFAKRGKEDMDWAFNNIVRFLQFQKERVEQEEIAGSTLKNFLKAIKLLCEVADITINWKKITRGLPKVRRYAEDRAPTIEEIQKLCEYPDRRIKSIIYIMASSGIRLGAWDYLRWGHIKPIEKAGKTFGNLDATEQTAEEIEYHLSHCLNDYNPEERYRQRKAAYYFHESYVEMEKLDYWKDRAKAKYCTGHQCIPDCPYYEENGRIEDEQVVKGFIDSTDILEVEDYKKELGEELVQSIINDWNLSGI